LLKSTGFRFLKGCGKKEVINEYGKPDSAQLPEPDIVYIVFSPVLSGVKRRNDVVAPDTGPCAVRDEKGQIIAVRGFVRQI